MKKIFNGETRPIGRKRTKLKFQNTIIINSIFLLLLVGICNYDADAAIGAYFSISEDISANLDVPEGLIFSPDGTKMYVVDNTGDLIEEYALSNAWQVSTATHAGSNYAIVDAQTDVPEDIAFNSDGTKMYLVDSDCD